MRWLTIAQVLDDSSEMYQVVTSDTALGAAEQVPEILPASEDPCEIIIRVYPEIPDGPDGTIIFDFEYQKFELKERLDAQD